MKIKVDSVNFRETPRIEDGNILAVLPLAHEVRVIDEREGQQFCEVETIINGQTRRGFVSTKLLRSEESLLKEKLMEEAVKEWLFFRRGDAQEYENGLYQRVGTYWQELGEPLDGRDRDAPWSAAFISYVAKAAGYNDFPFSSGHARYICDAKRKRERDEDGPYWLFRLNEHKPQLGDLICGWRIRPRTFETVTTPEIYRHKSDFFPSHTDVVVEISAGTARTIGGNVDQSVCEKGFALTTDGYLKPGAKIFAIMRNNR
jgi:hypothetical protein